MGCVSKHKVYNKQEELVRCDGPFKEIICESDKAEMKKATAVGCSRERVESSGSMGSTGAIGNASGTSKQSGMDSKIDWLVRTVKEMKDEVARKKSRRRLQQLFGKSWKLLGVNLQK
jgi:hypothetical protein